LDAAAIANISVEQLLNEPTSAGLAYGLDPSVRPDLDRSKAVPETALFFDLGGGTFDVSLMDLDIANGLVEVRSTSGDCFLGGDDFSALLAADITKATIETVGAETAALPKTMQRINDKAEIAKLALSTSEEITINMPYITQSHPKCEATLTRARFEEQMVPFMGRLTSITNQVLETTSNDTEGKPTSLVLVGGSTRIPAIRRFAAEILDKEPCSPGNPDELVARGAAIQAGLKNGELDTSVVLTDITPLTLGVEQADGLVAPIIARGSGLPALGEERFCLIGSPQPGLPSTAPVRVIQGERPNAADPGNRLVGVLDLPLSDRVQPGTPTIEVKFNLDASAVLTVTATDLTVMKEVTAEFSDTANLTQAELDNLVTVAQDNAPEDRAKAAIQSAVARVNYLYKEIQDKYLDETKKSEIGPTDPVFQKLQTLRSAIDDALNQGITKIASDQQQTWRDKCSQTIALIDDTERELKKRTTDS
jgi:molecular chaperone DnaK